MNRPTKVLSLFCLSMIASVNAHAIGMDWKGFFRIDHNYTRNYQMDSAAPGYSSAVGPSGEYIRGEGEKSATYTSLFARLKPSVLLNDNIIVHSEWNVGDPMTGLFGRGIPNVDRKNPMSTGKGTLSIEAARLWMDAHTDFGLLQLGRAPMHWGLGVIYNAGDDPMDRFQSTSDTIRFISKFGYLSVMPFYSKVSVGKNLAGSQDASGAIMRGSDDVTDFGVALRFHNPESEVEAGLLYNKRDAEDQQDAYYYPHSTNPGTYTAPPASKNGMNLSLFDFYAKKTWYRLTLGVEIPYYSGKIGNVNGSGPRADYKATGFAFETRLDFDRWHHQLKLGMAPGQGPVTTGARGDQFKAMYFNRNYKLGQILFRQNLGGFGSNNPDSIATTSVQSPYDASINNAKYIMLGTENRGEHWSWGGGIVYAKASETAKVGKDFYIHRTRTYGSSTAVENQSDSLGWEVDLNLTYNWDENIRFATDVGLFFPGDYFAFDNLTWRSNKTDMVTSVMFSATARF